MPFRLAHHYASELTSYGRAQGKRPKDLTPEELRRLYREAVGEELPVDAERIRQALDARAMVRGRRGLGGPQPQEVERMLADHRRRLEAGRAWLRSTRERLDRARAALEQAVEALRTPES